MNWNGCDASRDPSDERPCAYQRHATARSASLRTRTESGELRRAVDRVQGDKARFDAVMRRQYYMLHGWKLSGELTNYRRFFDIDCVDRHSRGASQRAAATHARIEKMIAKGEIDGLRVDHPDGLREPLRILRAAAANAAGGRIYIEKILENDERLKEEWPIDGTVGYEFLAKVNRLWMDDQRTDVLTATYADFTGHSVNFGKLVREKKRAIVETTFSASHRAAGRRGAARLRAPPGRRGT